jgi:molecular chaperone DnaK
MARIALAWLLVMAGACQEQQGPGTIAREIPEPVPEGAVLCEAHSPAVGADGRLTQDIGIETLGSVLTVILQKGTATPCTKTEVFSTAADDQEFIDISLFRGGAMRVAECTPLGKFRIQGIPKAPRGLPQIDVTFEARDGNVLLYAKDHQTRLPMTLENLHP